MKRDNKSLYIAAMSMICAFAIILSYIESLIPLAVGIPGIKLGLANFVIVICLYRYDIRSAIIVNFIRILVIGFMFGNLFSILFSLAGAFLSMLVMILAKKSNIFGIEGVSVLGGISHNIGQIVIASILVKTYGLMYYIPFLIVGGIITGLAIGILAGIIIKILNRSRVDDSIH